MDEKWLYIAVFALCYIWGSYGLPHTENQLKALLYPAVFAIAVCFAVVGIGHYVKTSVDYTPNYHVG